MKQYPLITIIIPTYNSSKYLRECLDSVKYQTYPNLEVIVVDGKSSDNTQNIINDYLNNPAWHLFVSKKGVSRQINVGLKRASGEYIYFLDSDDYFDNDFIEQMYKSYVNQKLDIITPSITCALYEDKILLETNKLECKIRENIDKDNFFIDMYDSFLAGPTKLYRKSMIEGIYFDEKLSNGEDHIFNYEIAKKNQFKYGICNDATYFYRKIKGENPISKRLNKSSTLFCKRFLPIVKSLKPGSQNFIDARKLLKDNTNQFLNCYVKAKKIIPLNMLSTRIYFFLNDHSKKRWFYLFPRTYLKKNPNK